MKNWQALVVVAAGCAGYGQATASQVVGGKAISITEAPWTAKMSGGCTGSWIGGKWALTAKHCGNPTYLTVGITRKSEASNTSLRTPVVRVIKHPNADISLLELARVPTNPLAKPIRPATAEDKSAGLTDAGKVARLSGWGQLGQDDRAPDSLHMLDHKIATKGSTSQWNIYYGGAIGGELQGSCFGDSGGPLAVRDATGTGWVQVGVVSGGSEICGDADPDRYGRVTSVEAWIRQYTMGTVEVFPVQKPLLPLAPNRIRLSEAQNLEISILNLSGAVVLSSRGFYPAGDHELPTQGLPAGRYLAKWQGERGGLQTRLSVLGR